MRCPLSASGGPGSRTRGRTVAQNHGAVVEAVGADPGVVEAVSADPGVVEAVGVDPGVVKAVGADPCVVEAVGADPGVIEKQVAVVRAGGTAVEADPLVDGLQGMVGAGVVLLLIPNKREDIIIVVIKKIDFFEKKLSINFLIPNIEETCGYKD